MDKKRIKIFDRNFAHANFTTDYQTSKYIEWDRNYQNVKEDELIFLTDNCMVASNNIKGKKIGMLMEPKAINSHIYKYIVDNCGGLDKILTYEKDLLELSDKFEFYPHCGCWIQPELQSVYPKTKLLSIISSHKQQTIGHRLRHDVISEIRQSNIDLDVYGRGYNPIQHKITAMKDYGFTIVIENSKTDYYFTEKLMDAFMTGTVPIYWGCPSIGNFFNLDGMIIFNEVKDLLFILKNLSLEKYHSMLPNIMDNFEKAKKYLIAEDWLYENTKIFK